MKHLEKVFFLSFLALLTFTLPACSKKEKKNASPHPQQMASAPEKAPTKAAPAQTAVGFQTSLAAGEKIYNKVCAACHAAGLAGAPKTGDQAAWKDRIAAGMDLLYQHAIKGVQGSSGVMPPKGGDMSLSDQQVKDAVDYMVQQSK